MGKEKKEIGKLLELLNEYENRDLELGEGEESNARTENNGHLRFNGANKVQFDTYMFDSLALSKRYGFIKWLVENDKIDFDNRDLKDRFMNEFERYPQFQNNTTNREFNINGLLMLLSISDTPIDFLCEILK